MIRQFAIGLVMSATASCDAPTQPVVLQLAADKWRSDLDFLAREIRTNHVAPFVRISRDSFEVEVAKLRQEIPQLSGEVIAVRLAQIAAMIGDGHTAVVPWPVLPSVPLRFYWFGDTLRVLAATSDQVALIGRRVETINGRSLSEVAGRLSFIIPQHESATFIKSWSASIIGMPDVLRAVGIPGNADSVALTLRSEQDAVERVTLRAQRWDVSPAALTAGSRVPTFARSRADTPLWTGVWPGTSVLYVAFSGYPANSVISHVADSVSRLVRDPAVKSVLFDVRQNGGGDMTKGAAFIRQVRDAVIASKVPVYVAIGRTTYSAALANTMELKRTLGARLLGETTGGRPVGAMENKWSVLPNSGLRTTVSTRLYRFSDVDTPGIFPDVELLPSWSAYVRGIDPVVEWISRQP